MHIEKNVFNNLFNNLVKARMDLNEYFKHSKLELMEIGNGKVYKPKAKFSFAMEQKCTICEWMKKKLKNAR